MRADTEQLDLVSEDSTDSSPKKAKPVVETETEDEEEDEDATPPPPTAESAEETSDNLRQVSSEEAEAYAKETKLLFFEASAKVRLILVRSSVLIMLA